MVLHRTVREITQNSAFLSAINEPRRNPGPPLETEGARVAV